MIDYFKKKKKTMIIIKLLLRATIPIEPIRTHLIPSIQKIVVC